MKKLKAKEWLMWIVGLFVGVGIGGLFLNGTFQTGVLLSLFPMIVHTIIGWVLVVGTLIAFVMKLYKHFI